MFRETELFDAVYTGTETRDPEPSDSFGINRKFGGYYIMRWLSDVAGGKNLGGWFDYIRTAPATFLEQARQTVLGGACEVMLFNYTRLISGPGAENMRVLREELGNAFVLELGEGARTLQAMPEEHLDRMRDVVLAPFGIVFHAPAWVGLYLLGEDAVVIENFNDRPVAVHLSDTAGGGEMRQELVLPMSAVVALEASGGGFGGTIPARSLVALSRVL